MLKKDRCYRRFYWGGFLLLFIASLSMAVAALLREPAYEEKPLSYWFNQLGDRISLPGRNYGCFLEEPGKVREAFQHFGTNALPFLVHKLGQSETWLHKPIQINAIRYGLKRLPLPSVDAERHQAATGLILLSPLPPEYLRQVVALTTNSDPKVASIAKSVLTNAPSATNAPSTPQNLR